jgi:hypothetical protein
MQAETFEQFNKFYSTSCTAAKQLDQFNTRLWGEFARQQRELMNLWAKWGIREFQALTGGKSPMDLFTAQSDIATEFSAKFTDYFRDAITSMASTTREVMADFNWPEELISAVMQPTERAEKPPREEAAKAKKSAAHG